MQYISAFLVLFGFVNIVLCVCVCVCVCMLVCVCVGGWMDERRNVHSDLIFHHTLTSRQKDRQTYQ